MSEQNHTDFGYTKVTPEEKTRRVDELFSRVAPRYDLMNDLMSLGLHRCWKRYTVYLAAIRPHFQVLDVAAGSADLARLIYPQLGTDGSISICDINPDMLQQGRDRCINSNIIDRIHYVQADAEALPFRDNCFDCITLAFGLRNMTDKGKALRSIHQKLKYGGQLLVLEFSQLLNPLLAKLYAGYTLDVIPQLGQFIANDKTSYRYLAESIQMHPDQQTLAQMLTEAGFDQVNYHNLAGGIVALHRAYKL